LRLLSLPDIRSYGIPIPVLNHLRLLPLKLDAESRFTRFPTSLGKGKRMYLLLWIPVGLIVGWLAGKSLEGNGYGRSMDLVMGAGGAVVGGVVMHTSGFSGYSGIFFATFVAVCCAALLTILVALVNGRTIYSKVL
jgi:uncharacterized membrane protein YeaQ/YmgE (transglycosylase-associated protein family)